MQVSKGELPDGRQGYEVRGYHLASRPDVATWWVVFSFSSVLAVVDDEVDIHLCRAVGPKVSAMRQGLMRNNRITVEDIRVDVDLALTARDED